MGGGEEGAPKFSLERFGITIEDIKELPLKTLAFCVIFGYVAQDRVENYKKTRLEEASQSIQTFVAKQNSLAQELSNHAL